MSNANDFVIEKGVLRSYTGNDEDIVIPNSVKGISGHAFYNSKRIKTVTIPGNVKSIEYGAFYGCSNLASVTLCSGIKKIDQSAFFGCPIKTVTIPDSVMEIGSCVWGNCPSLDYIKVEESNPFFTNDEKGILYSKDKSKLIAYPANNKDSEHCIANGVTAIEAGAFAGCKHLKSVVLPDSITVINKDAFGNCESLESIHIPDSVKRINDWAFLDCKNIDNVVIPDSVISIGERAFQSCEKLTSIKLPQGITELKENIFLYCESLETIEIPDSVSVIGTRAFSNCVKLASITIPEGVTEIGSNAFNCCENLRTVTLSDSMKTIGPNVFEKCKSLVSITIPAGVRKIEASAFCYCENLETVNICAGLEEIGWGVFNSCPNLRYSIWENGKYLGNDDNPYYAFISCVDNKVEKLSIHADTRVMAELDGWRLYISTLIIEGKDLVLTGGVLKDCKTIRNIEVKDEGLYFNDLPLTVLDKCPPPPPSAFAYIYLANSGKTWDKYFAGYEGDCNEVLLQFADALSRCDKISKKIIVKVCEYIGTNSRSLSKSTVAKVYNDMKTQFPDVAKALKADKICSSIISAAEASGNATEEKTNRHPIEALVDEYLDNNELASKEIGVVKVGIPYKNSNYLPAIDAVKVLLNEYVNLWNKYAVGQSGGFSTVFQLHIPEKEAIVPPIADKIAAELDTKALSDFLENLIISESSSYRPYTMAYARFATAETIEKCISLISSRKKGNAKSKYWAENMGEALLYSDHSAAAEYIEKNGGLKRYAVMRGMTEQEYRDEKSLPDFGFDANGVKTYEADGKKYEVRIDKNLTPELSQDGKIVKSIPKKTPEGEAAATDFAAMKKDFADFVKKRAEYVKSIYITGETIAADSWLKTYGSKQILLPFTERVIWQNGNNTFFEVTDGKIRDIKGNDFTPTEPVRIAHVLDMSQEEIKQWQTRIVDLQKTLLIEQVWEPVVSISKGSAQSSRYKDAILTKQERNEFKRVLKAKAINVRSMEQYAEFNHRSYSYNFSNENTMLIGNSMRLDYKVDETTGDTTLGQMRSSELNREINTVFFELDRLCARHHVTTDNAEALTKDILSRFTLAQITEFIDLAVANNSTNCTSLLLDYRNKTFGEVDPFSMFVL